MCINNKNIKNYSQKFIHYYNDFIPSKIEEILKTNKIEIFGDFGCGDGQLLFALKEKGYLDKIGKIYAIDISEERLSRVKYIDDRINIICSDIINLGVKGISEKFDFIVLNQVIEHIYEDNKVIEIIKNFLKDDGICYISTVFKKWYGWYFYKNKYKKWVIDPTHEREYQDNRLLEIIKNNNLDVIYNKKQLFFFPISDFFLKRFNFKNDVYIKNKIFNFLRNIKIPILGYYNWEIVFRNNKL